MRIEYVINYLDLVNEIVVSSSYLWDSAVNFKEMIEEEIKRKYPNHEVDINIETSGLGSCFCEDKKIQNDVENIISKIFNEGNFWPELKGYCIYCDNLVYNETAPHYDEDEKWNDLALEHEEDCEWILTRAHQLEN